MCRKMFVQHKLNKMCYTYHRSVSRVKIFWTILKVPQSVSRLYRSSDFSGNLKIAFTKVPLLKVFVVVGGTLCMAGGVELAEAQVAR